MPRSPTTTRATSPAVLTVRNTKGKGGKMSWRKVFDRAFDKCARLRPGESPNLTPREEEVLTEALRSDAKKRWEAKQEKRREHLRKLGWPEEKIAQVGVIPWQVLLLSNRPLTQAEKDYTLTIQRTSPTY
jgi:hypothetical protein